MALIVELFGPPGSGKTTFAKALTRRLRAAGLDAEAHLSARSGEGELGPPALGQFDRLVQPLRQIAPAVFGPGFRRVAVAYFPHFLIERLGRFKKLRMGQYLWRLAVAWTNAQARPGVVIFDQAYLQFIATVSAQAALGQEDMTKALRSVPQSGVSIRIDAAPMVLQERLQARHVGLGPVGRLFEIGSGSSERYASACDSLQQELERSGCLVLAARSGEGASFSAEVERATQLVCSRLQAEREAPQR